ncbi:MAG TPA: M48 family peptidase, partial [Opitutaceae bacterium]|nr:M48 family peptidase [Opitutaceae bacterium]
MVLLVTAALIVLRLAAELGLNAFNRREVRRHAGAPPPAVATIVDGTTYAKAVAYTLEKNSFGRIEM